MQITFITECSEKIIGHKMVICDMLTSAVTLRKIVSEKVWSRYNKQGNGR